MILVLMFKQYLFLILLLMTLDAHSKMLSIKGGSFTPLYGSAKKPVVVQDFEMDEYPVTNNEYLQFVKLNSDWQRSKTKKLYRDDSYLKHWTSDLVLGKKAPQDSPIVNVSWYAANAFCEARDKRLPTVYEWEYVASREIKGQDITKLILDWYGQPTPAILPSVKKGIKNSSGVSALHGLIWEWTQDFNSAMVTGESRADNSLEKTLFCGGGSAGAANPEDYAAFMRFAFRSSLKAKYAVNNLGFRCVKDISK